MWSHVHLERVKIHQQGEEEEEEGREGNKKEGKEKQVVE